MDSYIHCYAEYEPNQPLPNYHIESNKKAISTRSQRNYSTVTLFARLRGLSTSVPRAQAV